MPPCIEVPKRGGANVFEAPERPDTWRNMKRGVSVSRPPSVAWLEVPLPLVNRPISDEKPST